MGSLFPSSSAGRVFIAVGCIFALAGCTTSPMRYHSPMQATFSQVSDKPARALAECIQGLLGENAKLGWTGEKYVVTRPGLAGSRRQYATFDKIDGTGSVVEYESEKGRGVPIDEIDSCL